jgi:hypothetical protein
VTSIRDHSFHLDSSGQSVLERGVLNVLYSQCISMVSPAVCMLLPSPQLSVIIKSLLQSQPRDAR